MERFVDLSRFLLPAIALVVVLLRNRTLYGALLSLISGYTLWVGTVLVIFAVDSSVVQHIVEPLGPMIFFFAGMSLMYIAADSIRRVASHRDDIAPTLKTKPKQDRAANLLLPLAIVFYVAAFARVVDSSKLPEALQLALENIRMNPWLSWVIVVLTMLAILVLATFGLLAVLNDFHSATN